MFNDGHNDIKDVYILDFIIKTLPLQYDNIFIIMNRSVI